MSVQSANLLEKGYWEVTSSNEERSTTTRAKQWCIDLVKPSCVKRCPTRTEKLRRTAYLDGVRGFAALLVYWGHHELWAHDALGPDRILENAYGYDIQRYLACLPGVRLFFSGGHFAVTVFFVLSGYVLSTKPMAMIHAGEHLRLGDNLTSALFRRWLRLYLPVVCTTFLYMSSWHLFKYRADPEPKSTYTEELWSWYAEFKNFSYVFRAGGDPWFSYSFHTWSIPVEFRGSIVVYTALQAFSRCRRNARLWSEIGLILYFMYIVDGSFCALFVAGMLLCDLDLLEQGGDLPHFFRKMAWCQSYLFYGLFIISLYLGGSPSYSSDIHVLRESPGWYYLSLLKPQAVFDYKWFYLFWASTSFVASVQRITWLKSFFETRFNQYLGRISFAFYLVHGPLLWSVGHRLYAAVGWTKDSQAINIPGWISIVPLPKIGPFGLELSFLLPHLILLPLTLWVAEMATTLIDEPSVRFPQWLYGRTLARAAKL
ncbi:acyltransferase family-domain-containing protein [Exophiala viscosa]|uniref:Acyltransferase family-domain-containing protein n=1 Tax=Exophiala viscosa TaxID=2486360 RepID=A0AAN6DSN8_9EURO|nr:acyltransferase family-domain-containing protein [Exophiala viscosa]